MYKRLCLDMTQNNVILKSNDRRQLLLPTISFKILIATPAMKST